jgi:hypothetical protein
MVSEGKGTSVAQTIADTTGSYVMTPSGYSSGQWGDLFHYPVQAHENTKRGLITTIALLIFKIREITHIIHWWIRITFPHLEKGSNCLSWAFYRQGKMKNRGKGINYEDALCK